MNTLIEDLQWRGLIHQCTNLDALAARLSTGPVTLYCGFDPTADSLHVGSLVPLLTLARFQRAGHRSLALVGGATGLIGDPSGKSAERVLQTPEDVAHRTELIKAQVSRFLDLNPRELVASHLHGDMAGDFTLEGVMRPTAAVVNNLDWTAGVGVLEFLRDVGKHFSVNAMIHRDSVRSRLEREGSGLSFTEFSYMLLQAFDFLKLHEREGCELQIGGSDQWGNMCSGSDLIRRIHGKESFALTLPLLTTSDGQKFGKTVKGAVWLDAKLTSPLDFFQFWLNTADQDVVRFLKLFTFLSREAIEALEQDTLERPQLRRAQRQLAWEMTALVHGEQAAQDAADTAAVLFGSQPPQSLSASALEGLAKALPVIEAGTDGIALNAALVALELEPSKTRAGAAVKSGAVAVNGEKQEDPMAVLTGATALHGRYSLVRKGKKSFGLISFKA